MDTYHIPGKVDLTPRRHHGYAVLLFIMGTLFPPLAVAARFGIGKDFWINLLLTICGYIPGHGHNFYIQNIRNNKTHARTPKWAQRYGLVDISEIKRKERKSQWATRYNDRLPQSTLEGVPYEEGQEAQSSLDSSLEGRDSRQKQGNGLWKNEEETYYSKPDNRSSGRWRYNPDFDDSMLSSPPKQGGKKKKEKKDRWARTEDAYTQSEEHSRRKKSKKKRRSAMPDGSLSSRDSTTEFPEDPDGGLYGDRSQHTNEVPTKDATTDEVFRHEF
ncbi:hypothetical protein AMATHDRAFT_53288 [Amanita thiersii Skay4041]|uniref:Uncharacterized protein n=1 Tax=Amanita thiersii Skay4041 TaxID=703135 RepID=A0A2A9NTQ1_9AGAR|nr:hypothetical protein AMATHDRAFT_53288 [Amanita thiersii Skay4041]